MGKATDTTDDAPTQDGLYPIRAVSAMTGVNPVTLRAWERRYGLIKPQRTPKGHRLYSREDVELIARILDLLDQGVPVSQVRGLLSEGPELSAAPAARGDEDPWEGYSRRMLDAIARFDDRALESAYNDALSLYPVDLVTRLLIQPLLVELRQRWQGMAGATAEHHFFHSYLRNKLGARFHHQSAQTSGPKLLMACLPGEHSEIELLLFALAALTHGYRVVLLGANTSLEPLAPAAARAGAAALVLTGNLTPTTALIKTHLRSLIDNLTVPVFIGGEVAKFYARDLESVGASALPQDTQDALQRIDTTLREQPTDGGRSHGQSHLERQDSRREQGVRTRRK